MILWIERGQRPHGVLRSMAMGSASELEYHRLLARDLKLIDANNYEDLAQPARELRRLLNAPLQKLTADRLRT